MNKNRKDIAEKLKRLAERILENEGTSDLETLKSEHLSLYEDLILLSLEESRAQNSNEPAQPSLEKPGLENPEPNMDLAEPMTEQDELLPRKPELKEKKEKDPKKEKEDTSKKVSKNNPLWKAPKGIMA